MATDLGIDTPTSLGPVRETANQCKLSWPCLAVTAWFAMTFLWIHHTPLALDQAWYHAATGRWISNHQAIPTSPPNVPLSEGMVYRCESWLFDVVAAQLVGTFGAEGMSAATAIVTSLALWSWCGLSYSRNRSTGYLFTTAVGITLVWASGFDSLQPRLAGSILLALLLWTVWPTLVRDVDAPNDCPLHPWRWLAVPLLFAFWSNIDSSFFVGIMLLGAITLGSIVQAYGTTGFRGLVSRPVQRCVWILQIALWATLLNPDNIGAWRFAITTGVDNALTGALSGRGLYLPSARGITIIILCGIVVRALLKNPRASSAQELAVLAVVSLLTAIDSANTFWFAPLAFLVAARYWPAPSHSAQEATSSEFATRLKHRPRGAQRDPLQFAPTLLSALCVWCAFAFAPLSTPILGGIPRPDTSLFSAPLPFPTAKLLTEHRTNLVWAPREWSDWIRWNDSRTKVFADSRLTALPRIVQADHANVFRGEPGWERILDRYRVGLLIIDKKRQSRLSRDARRSGQWRLALETDVALVFQRNDGQESTT